MVQRCETPPRIETPRLILDGHREDDLEPMLAMFGDASVMRHIGGAPLPRLEVFRRLLRYRGTWPILGYGKWVIRARSDGRLLGQCGFFREERGYPDPYQAMPEAGWSLLPNDQHQGYAAEAMQAALAWLDAAGWPHSLCLIDPENAPSLALAGRLGYRPDPAAAVPGDTAQVLVRPRAAG